MAPSAPSRAEGVELIRRVAGGERRAFGEFYDRYAPLAFSMIRRIIGDHAEAEDILQEVFWQAWREAVVYDEGRGSPEAWLLNRARSRAIDRLRSIRRRNETFVSPDGEVSDGGPPKAQADPGREAEDRVTARSALSVLPAAQRQVLELAYYGGYTQEEIARSLGEPLGTVKTRMRTALERLRTHFREPKV